MGSFVPPLPPPPPPFRDPLPRLLLPPRHHPRRNSYIVWEEQEKQKHKEFLEAHPEIMPKKIRRAFVPDFLKNGTKDWMKVIFEKFPENVAAMILVRLPVKSLSRFKCVSKSWCAFISDSSFIAKYTTYNSYRDLLLVSRVDHFADTQVLSFITNKTSETLSTIKLNNPVQIVGPCNGVFCLFDGKDTIALWNPAMKEILTLPNNSIAPPRVNTMDTCIGFGFDLMSQDYKVLAFRHLCRDSNGVAGAELYSLSSDSWKRIQVEKEFEPLGNLPISGFNPSINGVFSWFEMDYHTEKVIFSFDMSKEVFMKTYLPDYGVPSKRVCGKLASYKNSLAFVHDYDLRETGKGFDVWVLGAYGVTESWFKFLTIGPLHGVDVPLGISESGKLYFEDRHGELICCDITTQTMKKIDVSGSVTQGLKRLNATWAKNTLRVFRYGESLVSVKKGQDEVGGSAFDFEPFVQFELNA